MTQLHTRSQERTPQGGDVLVDAGWLAAHLSDPSVRVVEVDVSPARYNEWHIDGALLWNVYSDLKDADYRLRDTRTLQTLLERSGVAPDSTVAFYGYAPELGMWLMKLCGHRDVRILDCSRETWQAAGHPWHTEAETATQSTYSLGAQDPSLRADRAYVEAALSASAATLLDVRTSAEYRGERFWPSGAPEPTGRAGHIPGAVHVPLDDIRDSRGALRSPEELRERFSGQLDGDRELITYCTVGGRATTAWFVLTYLFGRDNVRVYDGGWAEWGHAPDTAIDVGSPRR